MHQTIAFCTDHGFFPTRAILFSAGTILRTKGNTVTCPICRKKSEELPGTYSDDFGKLNLIVDPSISKEALSALQALAIDVKDGKISEEEAIERASDISPEFGDLFREIRSKGTEWLLLVIALTTLYLQYDSNVSSSEESKAIYLELQKHTAILERIADAEVNPVADQVQFREPKKIEVLPRAKPTQSKQSAAKQNVLPTKQPAVKQIALPKPKSKRRAQVNSEKRRKLRERRQQFSPK